MDCACHGWVLTLVDLQGEGVMANAIMTRAEWLAYLGALSATAMDPRLDPTVDDPGVRWRVKPEDVVRYTWVASHTTWEGDQNGANVRLVFDGQTNELKSAEAIK